MAPSVLRVAAALSLLPLWFACTGGAAPSKAKQQVCSPDTGYTCTRFNCTGYQRCLDDGSGYTPCVCNEPRAGSNSDEDAGVSGGRPAERCGNGIDDDRDGRLDCDDADCANMRCSPMAPKDWQGPIVLHSGAAPADCSGSFPEEAFQGGSEPSGAAPSCSACSCSGGGCAEFVDFVTGTSAMCGGDTCTTSFNGSCGEITPACLQGSSSAYLETRLPKRSGCTASEQKPTLEPAAWKTSVRACGLAAVYNGGCPADQLCTQAQQDAAAGLPLCIWREGEHDCPSGKYSEHQLLHRELDDTRGCSECSCKTPGCEYRWRVYNADDTGCTTPSLELKSEGQCVAVNASAGKLRVAAAISGDGSCVAEGGQSRGDVRGAKPVTVCCAP